MKLTYKYLDEALVAMETIQGIAQLLGVTVEDITLFKCPECGLWVVDAESLPDHVCGGAT